MKTLVLTLAIATSTGTPTAAELWPRLARATATAAELGAHLRACDEQAAADAAHIARLESAPPAPTPWSTYVAIGAVALVGGFALAVTLERAP